MTKLFINLIRWKAEAKAVLVILFLLLSSNPIIAQVKLSGIISDNNGKPLAGVKITGSGLAGAYSDFDGTYKVDVPPKAMLEYSFIGFETKKILVGDRTEVNVVLDNGSESLKEIVVIGYGTQKRGNINGSISSIKSGDLANSRQVTLDQMIQGHASGVVVTNNSGQPGGNVSIRIRGVSSLSGSNEPLYIIDGVPISGDATNSSTSGRPIAGGYIGGNAGSVTVSPLSLINPNDIKSIDILKDAAATAIYGSRGANGVVVITTKSGKPGTGKLTYDTYISTQEVAKYLKTMSLNQYATQQNELSKVYGFGKRNEFSDPDALTGGTDWQREIFKKAILVNHQLSLSGGSKNVNYYVSGGYTNQEGIVIGSGYKRYNFKTNIDADVNNWLKMGVNISSGISNEDITFNGSSEGVISVSLFSAPDVSVTDSQGNYSGPSSNIQGSFINPVAQARLNSNNLIRKNFLGNFYSDFKLFKDLSYRFEIGANAEFNDNEEFQPTYSWGTAKNTHASFTTRNQNFYSINVKNYLTYNKIFSNQIINVVVGQEANDSHWAGSSYNIKDFISNNNPNIHLGSPSTLTGTDFKGSSALYSYFGRFTYDFANKYNISGTMRADGSSKFSDGHKWGYFPSVGLSWKLSNESFMENTTQYIDNIKFRIGYGQTGNQNVANGAYLAGLTTIPSYDGNGYLISNVANPELTWETSVQTNLGLDFTLFDSKLSTSIDVYRKTSSDFLLKLPLPLYLTGYESGNGGLGAPLSNVGSMENKGIEINLNYSNKFTENFSWSSSLNFGKNKNELLDVVNGVNLTQTAFLNGYTPVVVTNTTVGGPIGQLYGYKAVGIIKTKDQLTQAPIPNLGNKLAPSSIGDIEYVDVNGDGLIDEKDAGAIGNTQANFTYGFTNTFKYKTIDFSIFLQGSQGGDILNLTKRAGTTNEVLGRNQLAEAADFYTVDNPDAKYPRPLSGSGNANLLISDRYVEDGSYLRIQNLTIGYSLPSEILSKIKFSRVRFYAGAQNLYTFTKYTGYDPEIGVLNQNELLRGIDNGRYPNYRSYTLGLNVEF